LPSLVDVPTRGSLAGDETWLAGVRVLSWRTDEELPSDAEWVDPPVEDRHVAWAGEIAGGRAALVLAPTEPEGLLVQAWFRGPGEASPDEMELVSAPRQSSRLQPLSLITSPEPSSDQETLVVVGLAGDEAEAMTGRTVTESAEVVERWEPVPMERGAGTLVLDRPVPAWVSAVELRVLREGQPEPIHPDLVMREDQFTSRLAPVDVADPRGLRARVDDNELRYAAHVLMSRYGVPARDLRPTLLAAGPVGGGSASTEFLLGATFPSGATGAIQYSYRDLDSTSTTSSMTITLAPAGMPLLEQVFAMATSNSVTVSGPGSGVVAEIYLQDGRLLTTVPLVDGAGVGPLGPPAADRVRILDARGAVVVEAALSEPNG
jgi:hypothetical protein